MLGQYLTGGRDWSTGNEGGGGRGEFSPCDSIYCVAFTLLYSGTERHLRKLVKTLRVSLRGELHKTDLSRDRDPFHVAAWLLLRRPFCGPLFVTLTPGKQPALNVLSNTGVLRFLSLSGGWGLWRR